MHHSASDTQVILGPGHEIHTQLGQTPLQIASKKGHLACVDYLLSCGIDVNCKDSAQLTALHYAAIHGHSGVAQRLIEAGANLHAVDSMGMTPLHQAAASGSEGVLHCLLEAGVSVNP